MQTLVHALSHRRVLVHPAIVNPSRTTWVTLGVLAAVGIGVVAFFSTRKAAAASAGAVAFQVNADCSTIAVVDEAAAKGAATAAALVVRPLPGDDALDAATQLLAIAVPQCDWLFVPDDRTFVHRGSRYTWAEVRGLLEGKTVGELTDMVGAGPAFVSSGVPLLVQWLLTSRPEPAVGGFATPPA